MMRGPKAGTLDMPARLSGNTRTTRRAVIGWMLWLPLLFSLVKLPPMLAITASVMIIAASAYGVWLAARSASKGLVAFAGLMTLLNLTSLFALSTPSALKGLYVIAWLYVYPYYANWVYWNL